MKKPNKEKPERLSKLSLYPLTPEESLRAFLQTDPEPVRKRLEEKGIVAERKGKKEVQKKRP